MNPLETMILPCPLDICDGDGICPGVTLEDSERPCPCKEDPWAEEPNDAV